MRRLPPIGRSAPRPSTASSPGPRRSTPSNLKLLSQEIVLGAGVHLVFHAWAAAPIVEEGRVTGAVFESKEGRLAIRAGVTIDCTGDGDLFHCAGAGSESDIDERDIHHCTN